jgi:hypothetical protein
MYQSSDELVLAQFPLKRRKEGAKRHVKRTLTCKHTDPQTCNGNLYLPEKWRRGVEAKEL